MRTLLDTIEAPKTHPGELWNKLRHYLPKHSIKNILGALQLFWLKAKALDDFDRLANHVRASEAIPGTVNRLQDTFYRNLDAAASINQINSIGAEAIANLKSVLIEKEVTPLKLTLVGEIYMVLEPKVNFNIERLLGTMGAKVSRSIYLTDWIYEHLILSIIKPDWFNYFKKLARPFLENHVGGHGLQSIAHSVAAGINRWDGIIHLAPFTCMPEIIAMQAMPTLSKELSIPALSIIIDEHSAEAGIQTRLEAFIDLLNFNRRSRRTVSPAVCEEVLAEHIPETT